MAAPARPGKTLGLADEAREGVAQVAEKVAKPREVEPVRYGLDVGPGAGINRIAAQGVAAAGAAGEHNSARAISSGDPASLLPSRACPAAG